MRFRFIRLRFDFDAVGQIHFPARKPGNILRGAFGTIFRKAACLPECESARTCQRRSECAYARTFEPVSLGASPSGLSDWPRPFVFRANHLDGCTIHPGELFYFDINLFNVQNPPVESFAMTFAEIGREGLGPGRGRARLTSVSQIRLDGTRILLRGGSEIEPSQLDLSPAFSPVNRIGIKFVAPTELKHNHQLAARPEFAILMNRVRDRLSTLSALYGDGPLPLDFAAFGDRAGRIAMTCCNIEQVEVSRVSSRTGQRHSLGGFVGNAEYEGRLGEFIPFLNAARFAGVGRQTTWGKGQIEIEKPVLDETTLSG